MWLVDATSMGVRYTDKVFLQLQRQAMNFISDWYDFFFFPFRPDGGVDITHMMKEFPYGSYV